MAEITIMINKKTLEASIDMEGYQGRECISDFNDIIQALNAQITFEKNKYEEVNNVQSVRISR